MEIPKKLQAYIESLDKRNLCFKGMAPDCSSHEIDDEIDLKLLDQKVAIPFSDAFEYKKRAVLLVGETGIGKTSIVDRFTKKHHARKLSVNNSLLYRSANDLYTFYDDIGSSVYPFFAPLLFPDSADPIKVGYVFHLIESSRLGLVKGKKRNAIDFMFCEGEGFPRSEESLKKLEAMFEGVKFYDLQKPYGYNTSDDVLRASELVRNVL